MRLTQNSNRHATCLGLTAIALSALVILGGCATQGPSPPQDIEQRVENARTESDHKDVASTYEQQAGIDKASSERHRRLALTYAKSWIPAPPWNSRGGAVPKGNPMMVRHCENLANLYEQASKANLELAAEHRRAAAGDYK